MSKVAPLNNEVAQKIATEALKRKPLAEFAFWPNEDRDDSNNYAHYKGELKISTVKLAAMLAEALENGEAEVRFFADLWQNEPKEGVNRPALSGNSRNRIVPRG